MIESAPERAGPRPGWFGGVMGTAALSVAAFRLPQGGGIVSSVADVVGWALLALASLGFVTLIVVTALMRPSMAALSREILSHERGPGYAAIPGSILVLILAFEAALPDLATMAASGWAIFGIILILAIADVLLTLAIFVSVFSNDGVLDQQALSGVWFMPQTVLLLISTALARLSASPDSVVVDLAAPMAVLFLGAGLLLFLLVGSLVLGRMIAAPIAPADGVPAAWIMMSPTAAAALALITIPLVTPTLMGAEGESVSQVMNLAAGAFVGFSIWWLSVVVILTYRQRRHSLTFSPALWSYVFPLAAVAASSGVLARTWTSSFMVWIAILMLVLAFLSWLMISVKAVHWLRARLQGVRAPAQ